MGLISLMVIQEEHHSFKTHPCIGLVITVKYMDYVIWD